MRRPEALRVPTWALTALIMLASCGVFGGETEPGGIDPEAIDPCSLLSEADAEQILGIETERFIDAGQTYNGCSYESQDGSSVASVFLRKRPMTTREFESESFGNQVEGVGDAAFWDDEAGDLQVLVGDIGFIVTVLSPDLSPTESFEPARTAAVSVIASMGSRLRDGP